MDRVMCARWKLPNRGDHYSRGESPLASLTNLLVSHLFHREILHFNFDSSLGSEILRHNNLAADIKRHAQRSILFNYQEISKEPRVQRCRANGGRSLDFGIPRGVVVDGYIPSGRNFGQLSNPTGCYVNLKPDNSLLASRLKSRNGNGQSPPASGVAHMQSH